MATFCKCVMLTCANLVVEPRQIILLDHGNFYSHDRLLEPWQILEHGNFFLLTWQIILLDHSKFTTMANCQSHGKFQSMAKKKSTHMANYIAGPWQFLHPWQIVRTMRNFRAWQNFLLTWQTFRAMAMANVYKFCCGHMENIEKKGFLYHVNLFLEPFL